MNFYQSDFIYIDESDDFSDSFSVIITTSYAKYTFKIKVYTFVMIECFVITTGATESINYEFKSDKHAWQFFNDKIKKYLH